MHHHHHRTFIIHGHRLFITQALLTTAAGMAVAIPASIGLTWADSVIDRVRGDMQDLAARIFVAAQGRDTALPEQDDVRGLAAE